MTYVREVIETAFFIRMCLFSSLIQSVCFLSLFELVSLLSKQFNTFKT